MLLNLAMKLFGSSNERNLRRLYHKIEPINALESQFEALSVDVPHAPSTALILAELKARVEYLDTMILRLRTGGDIAEAESGEG